MDITLNYSFYIAHTSSQIESTFNRHVSVCWPPDWSWYDIESYLLPIQFTGV